MSHFILECVLFVRVEVSEDVFLHAIIYIQCAPCAAVQAAADPIKADLFNATGGKLQPGRDSKAVGQQPP